jgi:hypothetical protein
MTSNLKKDLDKYVGEYAIGEIVTEYTLKMIRPFFCSSQVNGI